MSEGRKRKEHTAEFKAKVGLEAVRGVKTISEIAQAYGVHPVMVGQWKKEILKRRRSNSIITGSGGIPASVLFRLQLFAECFSKQLQAAWDESVSY